MHHATISHTPCQDAVIFYIEVHMNPRQDSFVNVSIDIRLSTIAQRCIN